LNQVENIHVAQPFRVAREIFAQQFKQIHICAADPPSRTDA